ncbi:MAG: ABC transporter permease [Desulfobacterales bacterium]|nr:MAG: ABC transporter permease [Desulfobacterales bacterium]
MASEVDKSNSTQRKNSRQVLLRRILRQKSGILGAFLILLFLTTAAVPGLFSKFDPLEMNKQHRLEPPSARFFFGTDEFGRDIFSRVIYGARVSLFISFFTVVLANFGGIILGVLGGYYGGLRDNIIMRLMDIMFSFPFILLAILIIAITGPGVFNVIISLAVAYLPYSARIARGAVMAVRENQYVEAAKASGASDLRVIAKYIMPNITAPIVVYVTMSFAFALLAEAGLQFLGLGARPPTPSWGLMLNETRGIIEFAPWTGIFPGLAIALAVIGFNLFGDGLRDLFDPKMKQ